MHTVKDYCVASIQMISKTDYLQNLRDAEILIAQAANSGAQMVVLPEFFALMGHAETDKLQLAEDYGNGILQSWLQAQANSHGIYLVGGTIPLKSSDANKIFNSCLVFNPDGSCIARYDKIHLFKILLPHQSHDESKTISPGKSITTFTTPWGNFGLAVCYDIRFPELFRQAKNIDAWIIPAAFTYATGKAHWEILLRARAIENQCYVIASAQGGLHDNGRKTFGHSMIINPWGKIDKAINNGEGLICHKMQRSEIEQVRELLPALQHRIF